METVLVLLVVLALVVGGLAVANVMAGRLAGLGVVALAVVELIRIL